ncbi:MAG: 16S rRNA (guanine(527)-N(7))-methyltransferase RsmG [Phycisphaerae bacterium]|mgnify:CR=1 FL=1|jgi:16S rRNA (guanine527-N7)-methyltransferase|nr:16S rRNA (guanine(527)-N(7))-methyltransferase RsmG [Phycisphaerae bacterium]
MNAETIDLAAAQAALAAHQEVFSIFSRLLIEHNHTVNLTRINTPEDIRLRHFLDSLAGLAVLDTLAADSQERLSLIDVGSGAGFPGLAIAIARPDWMVTSLEATEKKARFQRLICEELAIENVIVRCERAETAAHAPDLRERFDAATARAVAGLDVLAELTLAFVRPGGLGLFWKGPQVRDECAAAAAAFETMGAAPPSLFRYNLPEITATLYLAAGEKRSASPFNRPRRNFAAIKRHPLK